MVLRPVIVNYDFLSDWLTRFSRVLVVRLCSSDRNLAIYRRASPDAHSPGVPEARDLIQTTGCTYHSCSVRSYQGTSQVLDPLQRRGGLEGFSNHRTSSLNQPDQDRHNSQNKENVDEPA